MLRSTCSVNERRGATEVSCCTALYRDANFANIVDNMVNLRNLTFHNVWQHKSYTGMLISDPDHSGCLLHIYREFHQFNGVPTLFSFIILRLIIPSPTPLPFVTTLR